MRRVAATVFAGMLLVAGCQEAIRPTPLFLHSVSVNADSVLVGTPGRRLPQRITAQVTDADGAPVGGALVTWNVVGTGGWVDSVTGNTGADGALGALWYMGTKASEPQELQVQVHRGSATASLSYRAILVPSEVANISAPAETTTVKLRVANSIEVRATDPYGNVVTLPGAVRFTSLDTAVAMVDSLGTVRSLARGWARIVAAAPAAADTVHVHVVQVVAGIYVSPDTARFTSVAQRRNVFAYLVDDQGYDVADSLPAASVADTTIATRAGTAGLVLVSRANGRTTLTLTAGALQRIVPIVVAQVPESTSVTVNSARPIMLLPIGAPVPVICQAWDSNGVAISTPPVVTTSSTGAVSGGTCTALNVAHSGVDTLKVSFGWGAPTVVPIAVAAPLVVTPVLAESMPVDSYPSFYLAPFTYPATYQNPGVSSLRRNSLGQLELYVSLMVAVNSSPFEDLYRYESADGVHFSYDGVVLRHDTSSACAPLGYGMENVAIVPRSDAPGWRMYFSGGNFNCYGWQVFSAVSSDEKNWTIENGVRVSNGYPLDAPTDSATVPWPVGEGICVDQMPSGTWRMLVGGYDHTVSENKFQIIEWRSPDQLNWTYVGAVLRTDSLPVGAEASIYSPTVRKFAPGLWRMIFTGDDRSDPGGRSTLWSAVSVDEEHWQVEGQIMGQSTGNFYYAAVVDSTLVTMRDVVDASPGTGGGFGRYPSIAKVAMP